MTLEAEKKVWKKGLESMYDEREATQILQFLLEDLYPDWKERNWSNEDLQRVKAHLNRIIQGEPLQYVTGVSHFYDLQFDIGPGALIPRPETEELVQKALSLAQNKGDGNFLDICTGSGCIALAFKINQTGWMVRGVDYSEEALKIAVKNKEKHQVSVDFQKENALEMNANGAFWDIIVSNPPYIPNKEKNTMSSHVTVHEPEMALFVPDEDPILFYKAISKYASEALKPEGYLGFEIHENKGLEVQELMIQQGFSEVSIDLDIFDRPRMVWGRKGN